MFLAPDRFARRTRLPTVLDPILGRTFETFEPRFFGRAHNSLSVSSFWYNGRPDPTLGRIDFRPDRFQAISFGGALATYNRVLYCIFINLIAFNSRRHGPFYLTGREEVGSPYSIVLSHMFLAFSAHSCRSLHRINLIFATFAGGYVFPQPTHESHSSDPRSHDTKFSERESRTSRGHDKHARYDINSPFTSKGIVHTAGQATFRELQRMNDK